MRASLLARSAGAQRPWRANYAVAMPVAVARPSSARAEPVAWASNKLSDAVLDFVTDLTAASFPPPQATAVARGVCAIAEATAEDAKNDVNTTVTAMSAQLKAKLDVAEAKLESRFHVADANVQSCFEKLKLWLAIVIIGVVFVAVPMDSLANGTAGKLLSWGLSLFLKGR